MFKLDQVLIEGHGSVDSLGLLGLPAATIDAEKCEEVNVILTKLWQLRAKNFLELLSCDNLALMVHFFTTKTSVDLRFELLDLRPAGIDQMSATFKFS